MGKYGATRVIHSGYSFASKLESALFDVLKNWETLGLASDIKCQCSVYLTKAKILYKPDFSYVNEEGKLIYSEAKGFEADVWRIKRRLWKFYGPAPLEIWRGSYKNPYLDETIYPEE